MIRRIPITPAPPPGTTFPASIPDSMPGRVWTTCFWMPNQPDVQPSVMLWLDEASAYEHVRYTVGYVLRDVLHHGEHYTQCATMDALAEWLADIGLPDPWFSDCGDYALAASLRDVWTEVRSEEGHTGIKTINLWRLDRRRSTYHAPITDVTHESVPALAVHGGLGMESES